VKRRVVTVRKTTLAEADDRARDLAFWQSRPAAERFLTVFQMSEEAYAFAGKLPADPAGRPRSVARVLRP
jgi:hypothetical protein